MAGTLSGTTGLSATLSSTGQLSGTLSSTTGLSATLSNTVIADYDYENLNNKPSIETVTLVGDKSFEDLGLNSITNSELESMLS